MANITINDKAEKFFGRFDFPTFAEFIDGAKFKQDISTDSDLLPSSVTYENYSPFPKLISIKCEFARASDVEYPCRHENEYAAFIAVEICDVERGLHYGDAGGRSSFITYAYTDFLFYAGMPRVDMVRDLYDELRDKVMSDMSLMPREDDAHEVDIEDIFGKDSGIDTNPVDGTEQTETGGDTACGVPTADSTDGAGSGAATGASGGVEAAETPTMLPGTATHSVSVSAGEAKEPTDLILYTNDYGVSTMICKCDYDMLMAAKEAAAGKPDDTADDAEEISDSDAGAGDSENGAPNAEGSSPLGFKLDTAAIREPASHGYAVSKTTPAAIAKSPARSCYCPVCGEVTDPNKARSGVLGWDDAFMATARLFAMRSKDPNTQVGACIVDNHHRILSIGYNGTPNGMDDGKFPWGRDGDSELDKKYLFVCHSELNAVLNFRGSTERMQGATLYVDLFPCNECAKVIAQSGIAEVVYLRDLYPDSDSVIASKRIFDSCGISYRRYESGYDKIEIPMS